MSGAVLVTGATGTVGRELVSLLLQETEVELCLLLHERGVSHDLPSLLCEGFGLSDDRPYTARIQRYAGDITQPCLGLDLEEYRELVRRVTWVLHAAATTRFDLQIDEARRINVQGTAEVLEFASQCDRLERFGFLSTAYVAGRRTGTILESERTHGEGFANTYEQSKYEAEALVDDSNLPAAVYRLSTVLGDSRTGRVTHFTAPHQALQMMHLGLVAMLPGAPTSRVDLIPCDVGTRAIFELFLHHFRPGETLHITAPEETMFTLEEIVEESYRILSELDPGWARRPYPRPVIAPLEAFELFLRSAEQAENPLMQGVTKALGHFARQLAYPKQFDRTNVLEHLPAYDRVVPDVRTYYRDVVRYCLETEWGHHDRRAGARAGGVHRQADTAGPVPAARARDGAVPGAAAELDEHPRSGGLRRATYGSASPGARDRHVKL